MKGYLHIVSEAAGDRTIPLQSGVYDIGRGEEAAIQIDSKRVSRKHAEVVVKNNQILLIDCGSINGTLLNGSQVTTAELRHGDRISIGEVVLEFHTYNEKSTNIKKEPPKKVALDSGIRPTSRPPRSLRKILIFSLAMPMGASALITALFFRHLMIQRLEERALIQGRELVRHLAESNREDLRLGNELLLEVESVVQEKGVRTAEIVDVKGRVLAPISRLNQISNDPFLMEALEQKTDRPSLPSPPLGDGTYILAHPIRAYNDKIGIYETLGAAKIRFSPTDAAAPFSDANRLAVLVVILTSAVGVFIALFFYRVLLAPISDLAEKIHGWRTGGVVATSEPFFEEWKPLYDAVVRLAEEIPR